MVESTHDSGRRGFLKSGVLAAVGSGLLGAGSAVAAPTEKLIDVGATGIPLRPFGKTGHKLPVLGMGGSAFVQVFIAAYGVPLLPMDERVAMVRHGYDQGIRYFDTARVYGESEQIVGRAAQGRARELLRGHEVPHQRSEEDARDSGKVAQRLGHGLRRLRAGT